MPKRTVLLIFSVFLTLLFPALSLSQSSPIFGPKKYIREKGKPERYRETIQICALSGVYRLIVENGLYTETDEEEKDREKEEKEARKTKVSAAEIEINGEEAIEEDDFNKKVARIERSILLPQGENQMEIEVEGEPGAYITVTIECASGCLQPKITLPTTNITINRLRTIIQGNLSNTYGEAGVILRSSGTGGEASMLSQLYENSFAGTVPLQQGQNTITATATDACGYQAHDAITVNTESIQEQIRLTTNPQSGIPNATGVFSTTLEADASLPNPVSAYSWDTDGDGTADQTGKDLSKITAAYQAPGLYFPKVTVTDSQHSTYTETTIINVLSKEQMDALLKGKWSSMTDALGKGDVAKALLQIAPTSQQSYQTMFMVLGNQLPLIMATAREFKLISMKGNIAKYKLLTEEGGKTYSYEVIFIKDDKGLWKIKEF